MGIEDRRTVDLIAAAQRDGSTSLDLSDLGLTALPPDVFELRQLEQLNLWDNKLTRLPEAIGRLSNLTGLYLGGNDLTELPEAVGALSRLTILDVAGNRLARLPESIGKLSRLTTLDASGNPLTCLPSSVVHLTSLETLEVDGDLLEPELAAAVTSGPEEVRLHLARLAAEATSGPPPRGAPPAATSAARSDSAPAPAPRHRPALVSADSASLVSFALVVAATAALLVGLWQRSLTLVYVSIASTVLAWLVQAGARVRRLRQARRDAPSARTAHQ